ncbi:hypothetical protein ACU3L3_07350 [Priestia endophytica]
MNIFENDLVRSEIKRLETLIDTDDGRDVEYDIKLFKNALIKVNDVLFHGVDKVGVSADMWVECQDSLEKVLNGLSLDTDDYLSDYDNLKWVIVRR